MGCLKITYQQEVRQLGKNHFFLGECLEKGVTDEKKGIDYYPFGSVATHWEKEPYRFGYQGQFAEQDEETGYDHFELRNFDSKIGRWMNVDPLRQHASPYLGMGNNPLMRVDPDGGCDDPNCSGHGLNSGFGFFDKLFNDLFGWMNDFTFQISPEASETFDQAAEGNVQALDRVEQFVAAGSKAEGINRIANASPYLTVSIGKQTADGGLLSGYGSLMLTSSGIYATGGGDLTLSAPSLFTNTSLSLSSGLIFGPHSGIEGLGVGGGAGSFIGLEYSRSVNTYPNASFGSTHSAGFVLTNTGAWGSLNMGYTRKVPITFIGGTPVYTGGN